jgi:hypothetical protein
MLQDHTHRALAHLGRERRGSLLRHDLTLLKSWGLRKIRAGSDLLRGIG